ncbi:hypothetical protein O5468_06645 [Escherichia coli]|nr:hypothetical protein [Escherichia coli]
MWVVTSELTRKGGQRPGKSSVPCWQGWLLVCFCRHSLYWRQPMTIRQLEVVEQAHPCPWVRVIRRQIPPLTMEGFRMSTAAVVPRVPSLIVVGAN